MSKKRSEIKTNVEKLEKNAEKKSSELDSLSTAMDKINKTLETMGGASSETIDSAKRAMMESQRNAEREFSKKEGELQKTEKDMSETRENHKEAIIENQQDIKQTNDLKAEAKKEGINSKPIEQLEREKKDENTMLEGLNKNIDKTTNEIKQQAAQSRKRRDAAKNRTFQGKSSLGGNRKKK